MLAREANDERQHVPRYPADHERAEDDGDRAQSFAGPVVVASQQLKSLPFRISHDTYTHTTLISRSLSNKLTRSKPHFLSLLL